MNKFNYIRFNEASIASGPKQLPGLADIILSPGYLTLFQRLPLPPLRAKKL
ncbi:hypothetical protein [Pseudomonas sp. NPDC007930]|uniref:hypothetical protein n=1 Tax=Pseudomonas sp. NPDC007930 TaxID=3364417 RepID=UPI0036E7552F